VDLLPPVALLPRVLNQRQLEYQPQNPIDPAASDQFAVLCVGDRKIIRPSLESFPFPGLKPTPSVFPGIFWIVP
jgi:hypothetical protein